MSDPKKIPVNLITGFLGAGKTTAILHLLKSKPKNERWAVLVNEFGEVGIDGSLYAGKQTQEQGIYVREVPGGCMCCTAGIPMHIALSLLIEQAKPDRLLIEPTGLGHPQEVMAVLSSESYQDKLDLNAVITLVDARKIGSSRYADHASFGEQVAVADVIVANKSDLYGEQDYRNLIERLEKLINLSERKVFEVEQGCIEINMLESPAVQFTQMPLPEFTPGIKGSLTAMPETPEDGYLSIINEGEGFYSKGWIFNTDWTFDANKLYLFFMGVENVERLKGVFITDDGITSYNVSDNVLTVLILDDCLDSRIEVISRDKSVLDEFEQQLLDCTLDY